MEAHVRWVIEDAGLSVDEAAVAHVVRRGAGSVRDTLSALEQVAALGRTVGDGEPLDDLVDALSERNPGGALAGLAAALAKGREVRLVGEELLGRLRDAFLASVGATAGQLTEDDEARARVVAEALGPAGLTRALEALGEALLEMRQAPDPRIPLEVALLRLTRPELDSTLAALVERVAALELALAGGAAGRLAAVDPGSTAYAESPMLRPRCASSSRPRPPQRRPRPRSRRRRVAPQQRPAVVWPSAAVRGRRCRSQYRNDPLPQYPRRPRAPMSSPGAPKPRPRLPPGCWQRRRNRRATGSRWMRW